MLSCGLLDHVTGAGAILGAFVFHAFAGNEPQGLLISLG